jgi:hypothetical protein
MPVTLNVTGVAAVQVLAAIVNIALLAVLLACLAQPPAKAAVVTLGTSVPAVAVQASPEIGLLSQKSSTMPSTLPEACGVTVTSYCTLVAPGVESLICILRVPKVAALALPIKIGIAATSKKLPAISAYTPRCPRNENVFTYSPLLLIVFIFDIALYLYNKKVGDVNRTSPTFPQSV